MHTKVCPRCGQQIFDDMPVCYECLFEFAMQEDVVPIQVYEDGEGNEGDEPTLQATSSRLRVRTASVDLTVPIPSDGLVIGRGSACDIVLHTPAVSRRHVRVEPREGGILVTNLGARNPASIDGEPVLENAFLSGDDELFVCGSTFSPE